MTHIDQHTQALETPPGGRPRTRSASLRTVLGSAVAVATVAGATVLGVATLASDDQNQVTGGPPSADQTGSRATHASVQDQASRPGRRAPACSWTSEVNAPVFPAEDLGGPPTPGPFLIFERCNSQWTGNIAWSNPDDGPDLGPTASPTVTGETQAHERFASCVEAETRSRAAISTSDDGLPNPWEAGSIAAKCYLSTDT